MDFFAHRTYDDGYDKTVVERGARVHLYQGHKNLVRQWLALREVQKCHGPFDIVHSHVDYYGGVIALLARLSGVRGVVVSSHNDTRPADRVAPLPRRFYISLMKFLVRKLAAGGLGTSGAAAAALFGDSWRSDPRWRVFHACVNLQRFREPVDRQAVRAELGLPPDAIVIGHVGRFVEQKNHRFLVQIAEILAAQDTRFHFLLVGVGPLLQEIREEIERRGLGQAFVFLSSRDDVARLMLGAMDAFLFPSMFEGLGLALVEAQASGLRCFASTEVPEEALVVPSLVDRLPLVSGARAWADTILEKLRGAQEVTREQAFLQVEQRFDIHANARQLLAYYRALAS